MVTLFCGSMAGDYREERAFSLFEHLLKVSSQYNIYSMRIVHQGQIAIGCSRVGNILVGDVWYQEVFQSVSEKMTDHLRNRRGPSKLHREHLKLLIELKS